MAILNSCFSARSNKATCNSDSFAKQMGEKYSNSTGSKPYGRGKT